MSSVYGYYGKNISSTSSSSTSLGISGMVSGMDVDSVVEAMCSGTSSKISKVQQNMMKLEWKQEAYQDVGTAMTDFQTKYLSSTSTSSISSLLSDCYSINAKGDNASAISASGSPDILSNFSVLSVSSLATNASFTSASGVTQSGISTGKLTFNDDPQTFSNLEGKTFAFKIGSTSYSLELGSELITDAVTAKTAIDAAITRYDQEHDTGTGTYVSLASQITVGTSSGKLTFATAGQAATSGANINIGSSSSSAVLKAFGLEKDEDGNMKSGTSFTAEAGDYSDTTSTRSFFSELSDGASMTFDLDGVKGTVTFDEASANAIRSAVEEGMTEEQAQAAMLNEFVNQLNTKLSSTFGNKVNVSANAQGGVTFSASSNNSILSLSSASSSLLGDSGILGGLELGDANRLLTTNTLEESNFKNAFDFGVDGTNTYEMEINGVSFSIGKNKIVIDGEEKKYTKGVTMKNVMDAINSSDANVKMSYLSTTDRFTVTSTQSGAYGTVDISGSFADMIFGSGAGAVDEDGVYQSNGSGTIGGTGGSTAGGRLTQGTDAKILVSFDGQTVEEITRSTNSFKLDGLKLSLSDTFNESTQASDFTGPSAESVQGYDGALTFEKTVEPDDLVEAVKTMVEDYNSLIEKVVDYYTTKGDSDYQPLTSDMVDDENLTDEQAEKYNNKAKEGVLFGDSILRSLTDDMRSIFTGLSSIGITTSSDYSEYGKLTFDESTFRSAMEADTQAVADKFTTETTGCLSKLESMMKKYVNSSIASPGLITAKSGLASSSLTQMNCSMYSEMEDLNSQLDSLQDKLETQQDRYYEKFTNMEVALSELQSQSSYLGSLSS